ncbi:tRNA (adenosine(37)-N6)-threonylcarbamoyltransferase complex dimerization subunit type 1 TsaB [Spiroplasma sp. SV19]|uniref:tRNA (adenosine(37)-N6)-threonylcarbamoyltransferase complex dimerization subunit type 1 TsaB n=1 Tax=Spiroplasma sp. SV19 TaxID=2570468 RepID=UPI0024B7A5E3|nr:tRNA (adenosine(37)-N6)-threonylcarbamoyltransferase complex dimerization subunit type 1 TsaB [Spiroplasma sp. SV19]WHQ37540.1 tRNA (adenosine(37)-N6)-threonylcarbamoyltransferase complex dimerization subunit type 1 TsaB [Spiroplasma sp. SV19]
MLNLFIDTSTTFLTLILEQDNKILGHVHQNNARRHTEETLPVINELLAKYHFKLKDVNHFYLTAGPGSYTGIRVPMTIVKTIKIINPTVQVSIINTLLYQAGLDNVVSILDARGGQRYFAVLSNGQEIIPSQVIDYETCLEISKQFPGYQFRSDLQEIDLCQNYQALKNHFHLVDDIFVLEPRYIKKALG